MGCPLPNSLGELAIAMVYFVAKDRFKVQVDEDLLHDVLVGVFTGLRTYDPSRGKITTFLYYAVVSEMINQLNKRNELRRRECFLEDVSVPPFQVRDSFYGKFLRILSKYYGLVGEDLLRILMAGLDKKEYSNRLRSAELSKEKGLPLLERWLSRPLTQVERQLVEELRQLLV